MEYVVWYALFELISTLCCCVRELVTLCKPVCQKKLVKKSMNESLKISRKRIQVCICCKIHYLNFSLSVFLSNRVPNFQLVYRAVVSNSRKSLGYIEYISVSDSARFRLPLTLALRCCKNRSQPQ